MYDRSHTPMPAAPASNRPFREILVALDASPHSRAALGLAVQLAADLEADLDGLFVKDANLLRAAQLPFAEEVRTHSVSPKALSDRRVQRQLRHQAERAEAALQEATERAQVSYNFRVVEGQVPQQLLRAAEDTDLVAMGKTSTQSSRRRLGTTSRALLAESPAPVLVLRRATRHRPPLFTYYDGSDTARSALRTAAQLGAPGTPLTVFLPADDEAQAKQLQDDVHDTLGMHAGQVQVRPLTPTEADRLAALARRQGPGLFVMPDNCSPLANTSPQRFLYELDHPLLVVR